MDNDADLAPRDACPGDGRESSMFVEQTQPDYESVDLSNSSPSPVDDDLTNHGKRTTEVVQQTTENGGNVEQKRDNKQLEDNTSGAPGSVQSSSDDEEEVDNVDNNRKEHLPIAQLPHVQCQDCGTYQKRLRLRERMIKKRDIEITKLKAEVQRLKADLRRRNVPDNSSGGQGWARNHAHTDGRIKPQAGNIKIWPQLLREMLSGASDDVSWETVWNTSYQEENMPTRLLLHPCVRLVEREHSDSLPVHAGSAYSSRASTPVVSARPRTKFKGTFDNLPTNVLVKILCELLVFDKNLVHAFSRLDPFEEPQALSDAFADDYHLGLTRTSGLKTRFFISGKERAFISLTHNTIMPRDLLAPLVVSRKWCFYGCSIFYSCNTFAFSSFGEFDRFANGIGPARVQRLTNVELHWMGGKNLRWGEETDNKLPNRRVMPLAWLCEMPRLQSLVVFMLYDTNRYLSHYDRNKSAVRDQSAVIDLNRTARMKPVASRAALAALNRLDPLFPPRPDRWNPGPEDWAILQKIEANGIAYDCRRNDLDIDVTPRQGTPSDWEGPSGSLHLGSDESDSGDDSDSGGDSDGLPDAPSTPPAPYAVYETPDKSTVGDYEEELDGENGEGTDDRDADFDDPLETEEQIRRQRTHDFICNLPTSERLSLVPLSPLASYQSFRSEGRSVSRIWSPLAKAISERFPDQSREPIVIDEDGEKDGDDVGTSKFEWPPQAPNMNLEERRRSTTSGLFVTPGPTEEGLGDIGTKGFKATRSMAREAMVYIDLTLDSNEDNQQGPDGEYLTACQRLGRPAPLRGVKRGRETSEPNTVASEDNIAQKRRLSNFDLDDRPRDARSWPGADH
ncbi:hypothetical protein M406DRAFT_74498 [Cryphonectria parasitica EP155]|uniref:Uncharacterized protein n=1 Tax=Cryphonectria parasitica (strain ATCC 38755 / EP155) TaxID=660469 RepID=A0A9P4XVF9_CRYP1|nr:uncharacterized protein M406DRAFT_74498 [Cryphonectria parasitica EP155]KAF3761546.1 hypothetical protein M406DRAFT_74498 [Cryphonectria parasitica EP155]